MRTDISSAAIFVENISKNYGAKQVLRQISFAVNPGEVFGFLGPNGAGKTTTIRIICGLLRPTSGRCLLFGQDPLDRRPHDNRLGVVFEESNLYDRLSARQNLNFFAALYGISTTRCEELLRHFGLPSDGQPVSKFSKGMKQRLLLARALLNDPKLLILDEPTSGLDPKSAAGIRQTITELRRQGKTVFLSTHSMEEADEICDRVAFIDRGSIAAVDSPARLKRRWGKPVVRLEIDICGDTTKIEGIKKIAPDGTIMSFDSDIVTLALPWNESTATLLPQLSHYGTVLSLHSQEATLTEVFHRLVGNGQ